VKLAGHELMLFRRWLNCYILVAKFFSTTHVIKTGYFSS